MNVRIPDIFLGRIYRIYRIDRIDKIKRKIL